MRNDKLGRKTSPGFADPRAPIRVGGSAGGRSLPPPQPLPPPSPVPGETGARRSNRARPIVEIDVIHERSRMPRPPAFAGCYEIWTQNNVYAVDARMRCVEVRERSSGNVKGDHPFVGTRLVGGQFQDESMEMSYPLPRPGAFAVFEMRKGNRRQFTRTSEVERVVLRMRIVTISDAASTPMWESAVEPDD